MDSVGWIGRIPLATSNDDVLSRHRQSIELERHAEVIRGRDGGAILDAKLPTVFSTLAKRSVSPSGAQLWRFAEDTGRWIVGCQVFTGGISTKGRPPAHAFTMGARSTRAAGISWRC